LSQKRERRNGVPSESNRGFHLTSKLTIDNPFGRQELFAIKPVLLSVLTQ